MCDNDNYSCLVAWLLAILFGFLVGLLFFLGLITNVSVGLIVALVSAFVISICFFVAIIIPRYNDCVRKFSCDLVVGIIGTVFFATIALSVTLTTNIISAILVGLVVFFLTYLMIKFLKLLTCIINRNDSISTTNFLSMDTSVNLDNAINSDFNSGVINNTTINNSNSNNNNSNGNNNNIGTNLNSRRNSGYYGCNRNFL